ncbi:MAG: DUF1080 domain-containing protein [Cyclobacteriaceae bacterium]|nr:DUF1080 domain-containing protein [Cyclobacteriaceae bacterium]
MKRISIAFISFVAIVVFSAWSQKNEWVSLFDGKSFDGWKLSEHPETFKIENGLIAVHGERAHMFYDGAFMNHDFRNFEFKATIKTTPGSNSGIFILSEFQPEGWPSKGFEIQVNNSHTDWRKTGSVYAVQDVKEVFVKDDEWFTMHIKVVGKTITVSVNDKVINTYTEGDTDKSKFRRGTIALQGHDPKSIVYYKDVMIKALPD